MHDSSDGFRLIVGINFPGCSPFMALCKTRPIRLLFHEKIPHLPEEVNFFLGFYMSVNMVKSFIDLNLIDLKAFFPSCRYCLIGTCEFHLLISVFLWVSLYESCMIFQMVTAIIPIT